jgi:hypothetical protein
MSLKPVLEETGLENKSLNLYCNSLECDKLTVNGNPSGPVIYLDGTVTPVITGLDVRGVSTIVSEAPAPVTINSFVGGVFGQKIDIICTSLGNISLVDDVSPTLPDEQVLFINGGGSQSPLSVVDTNAGVGQTNNLGYAKCIYTPSFDGVFPGWKCIGLAPNKQ